ncbi:hypothetical protein, partial [Xanthomonas campestris]|uniref:hypothetical protein n=1 Tax=Xanthomonas campestris TaxID=339 RepID=UPI003CF6D190
MGSSQIQVPGEGCPTFFEGGAGRPKKNCEQVRVFLGDDLFPFIEVSNNQLNILYYQIRPIMLEFNNMAISPGCSPF